MIGSPESRIDRPSCPRRCPRQLTPLEVDTTRIRLLDGSRAFLHAVIDNFSRRILVWTVAASFDPAVTTRFLIDASKNMTRDKPMLLVDGGVENFNSAVDKIVDSGLLKRVLARTEINFFRIH